jgi:hypothetical protein
MKAMTSFRKFQSSAPKPSSYSWMCVARENIKRWEENIKRWEASQKKEEQEREARRKERDMQERDAWQYARD